MTKEEQVLQLLQSRAGQRVSIQRVYRCAWGGDEPRPHVVSQCIARLRCKLNSHEAIWYILPASYCYVPDTREVIQ